MPNTLHPLIAQNREQIAGISRQYGLSALYLVGSMARGLDHAQSDADFLYIRLPAAPELAWINSSSKQRYPR